MECLLFQEQELQQQICSLQGQLNDREALCRYCASKLDVHIGKDDVKEHQPFPPVMVVNLTFACDFDRLCLDLVLI